MILPSFDQLKLNYPTDLDPNVVTQRIGGQIGRLPPGTNTCVIRMSKAFNYAGKLHEIPAHLKHPSLLTYVGGDQKNYACRVREFLGFLAWKYGPPTLSMRYKKTEKESITPFLGKKGIIAWRIQGWDDAAGHFTLWDGSTGLYEGGHDYFSSFPITYAMPDGTKHTVWESGVDFWNC